MANCLGFPPSSSADLGEKDVKYRVDLSERKARDARITAFALTIVALVFMSLAFALFGASTLPPEVTMGLGMFPYLGGTLIGTMGIAVFMGALAHMAIASVRDCQSRGWELLGKEWQVLMDD
ncbi:MAG: hypothetical protein JJU12_01160 [Chlamydiales bacterium]|nr:hypothetical protein [Chlamydiales bacterium]